MTQQDLADKLETKSHNFILVALTNLSTVISVSIIACCRYTPSKRQDSLDLSLNVNFIVIFYGNYHALGVTRQ